MENPTSILIGKPLWRCTRAADMACFQFGGRHKRQTLRGEDGEVGDYALHVQCSWRITRGDEIVVAKEDLYEPEDGVKNAGGDYFDWQKHNLEDARLRSLFADNQRQFAVVGTALRAAGELDILFDDELRLAIFPDSSTRSDEHWRLFVPSTDTELSNKPPHIVFCGDGLHFE